MDSIVIGGDLSVARMGFGAMRLCGPGIMGYPVDRDAALNVLRRALELGVTLVDTADAYGPGVNEDQIAQALHPYAHDLVIATKGGNVRPDGRWVPDGRPTHLRAACKASLRRLKLERIDLYQWHAPDSKVPFDESIGALKDLRDEGKIRHLGLSNVSVAQLARARAIVPIASVQNRYNSGSRESDSLVDVCTRDGLAFLPYFRSMRAILPVRAARSATSPSVAVRRRRRSRLRGYCSARPPYSRSPGPRRSRILRRTSRPQSSISTRTISRHSPRNENGRVRTRPFSTWWAVQVSNLRPLACHASALPLS